MLFLATANNAHAQSGKNIEDKLHELYNGIEIQLASNADSAYLLSREYYQLSRSIADSIEMAHALYYLATSQYYRNKLNSAEEYGQKALKLYSRQADSISLGETHNILGNIYADQGNYIRAIDHYKQALENDSKQGKKETEAIINLNIAYIYLEQENYDLAEEYLNKAFDITEKYDYQSIKASILNGLVDIYLYKEDYQRAKIATEEAMAIATRENDKLELSTSYLNFGLIACEKKQFDKAINMISKAIELAEDYGDGYTIVLSLKYLAHTYIRAGRSEEALYHAEQAYQQAVVENTPYLIREAALTFSRAYELAGNYEQALKFYKIYSEYHYSLVSVNVQEKILEDENALRKKQNKLLTAQNELSKKVIVRNRWLLAGVGILLLIGIAFIYFLVRNNKKQRKYQLMLEEQNRNIALQQQEIEKQKKALLSQNKELSHLNSTKDKLFSILTHDLKQPFNQMLSLLSLMEKGGNEDQDIYLQLIGQIKESTQHTHNAVENLLIWSKSQFTGIKLTKTKTDIKNILYDLEKQCSELLKAKEIEVQYKLEYELLSWTDPNQVEIIIRNLLINAIKFSPSEATIKLEGSKANDCVIIGIADDGIGLNKEQINQLRDFSDNLSTPGTLNEKGTGLGIMIVQDFLKANGGKLHIESIPGKGSKFLVYLPEYQERLNSGVKEYHQEWKLN